MTPDSQPSRPAIELRSPPRPASPPSRQGTLVALAIGNLLAVGAVGALLLRQPEGSSSESLERERNVASRLLAAGAVDEAATLYGSYLESLPDDDSRRARIAYSLGAAYLDAGRYESGLRWLYEAEATGAGELSEELGRKIVHTLDRMGRTHAAEAALASRVRLEGDTPATEHSEEDPVLARIGETSFRRSEIERALDALPPELAASFSGPQGRAAFLQRFVAQELLWRKAKKQEVDRDPEVRRLQEDLFKQVVVSRFLEQELGTRPAPSRAALESYFEAHRDRYGKGPDGEEIPLEKALPAVERDLRLEEAQEAYQKLVGQELAAADVELFADRWSPDAS